MSIKGSRATTKNLSTLIECSENGDDSASMLTPDEPTERNGTSCSAYETASSKFSANGDDTVVECITVCITCREALYIQLFI